MQVRVIVVTTHIFTQDKHQQSKSRCGAGTNTISPTPLQPCWFLLLPISISFTELCQLYGAIFGMSHQLHETCSSKLRCVNHSLESAETHMALAVLSPTPTPGQANMDVANFLQSMWPLNHDTSDHWVKYHEKSRQTECCMHAATTKRL